LRSGRALLLARRHRSTPRRLSIARRRVDAVTIEVRQPLQKPLHCSERCTSRQPNLTDARQMLRRPSAMSAVSTYGHFKRSAAMCRLDGKIALITGGASGIGLATAREFRAAGAQLAIADIADAGAVARELGAIAIHCDVTDAAAVDAMVQKTIEHYGRLDVLFNNAGIEKHGPIASMDLEAHRRVIDVDLNGVYYCLQAAIRAMANNDGPSRGSIINTASVAGLIGAPGLSSYNAAKGGVVLLTKVGALEAAPLGIRINAVCPGVIRTPMADAFGDGSMGEFDSDQFARRVHPLGRMGEAHEVAKLVTFLASDDASFITGAAIPIDGGMTAGIPIAAGI
jgi:NAD(P)-dependent dehydrogenase (short-subunit alcohol dehydrogenase family)